MADTSTVVKVGGSLFDWPGLREGLHAWLTQLDAPCVLLVPGGSLTADAVRVFDRAHHLGEEKSHELALRAMSLNAHVLQALLPSARIVSELPIAASPPSAWHILDAYPFFLADDERADPLPHTWRVTSDSLALRAALLVEARRVILLKSRDWQGRDWSAACREQVVDEYFPEAVRQARVPLEIDVVNLREWRKEPTI